MVPKWLAIEEKTYLTIYTVIKDTTTVPVDGLEINYQDTSCYMKKCTTSKTTPKMTIPTVNQKVTN